MAMDLFNKTNLLITSTEKAESAYTEIKTSFWIDNFWVIDVGFIEWYTYFIYKCVYEFYNEVLIHVPNCTKSRLSN